jgi:hypothetical protein
LLKPACAVKFIRPDLAAHPATAARFAREVQAVTGLTHANTVRVYDYGRAEGGPFCYVMEYLDGPTLEELVRRAGPLPPGRAVYLLRQVCGALAEAHAAGLVHRDLLKRFRKEAPTAPIYYPVFELYLVCDLLDEGKTQDAIAFRDYCRESGLDCAKHLLESAKGFQRQGSTKLAGSYYKRLLLLEPTNREAEAGLKKLGEGKKGP